MSGHDQGRLLVAFDFDRTIFDTHRYYLDLLEMITAWHGPAFAGAMRAAESESTYFDPFAYLSDQGIDYDTATAAFLRFHDDKYSGLPSGSYLFADAVACITALDAVPHTKVVILTTGTVQSQKFKLSLCPELQHIPHQIIPGNKGLHLQQEIDARQAVVFEGQAYEHIALVDDRDDVLAQIHPKQGHQLFHIVRPGSKYQRTISRADIQQISSLTELISLLDQSAA